MDKPTFLYRAYDDTGTLLYVGITYGLHSRVRQHSSDKDWWDRDVARVEAVKFPTREEAQDAEAAAVHAEEPKWNIRMPGGPDGIVRRRPKSPPKTPKLVLRPPWRPVPVFETRPDLKLLGVDEGGTSFYADSDGNLFCQSWFPGIKFPEGATMLPYSE